MDQKRREVWATKDSLLFCPADKKILPKGEGPRDKFGPEERECVVVPSCEHDPLGVSGISGSQGVHILSVL